MEQEYLTVTALTKYIKTKFDRDPHLDRVYLTGEISNFNKNSVHKYFNLKDENAIIAATMFQGEIWEIPNDYRAYGTGWSRSALSSLRTVEKETIGRRRVCWAEETNPCISKENCDFNE